MNSEYISPRLFALISLVVLVCATIFLAPQLGAPAVAAVMASLGNVIVQIIASQAGQAKGGPGIPASSPSMVDAAELPEVAGKASRAAIVARPGGVVASVVFAGLAVLAAALVSVATGGCGHTMSNAAKLHVVELLAGDCAEIAKWHSGSKARAVELVCNGVEAIAERQGEAEKAAEASDAGTDGD